MQEHRQSFDNHSGVAKPELAGNPLLFSGLPLFTSALYKLWSKFRAPANIYPSYKEVIDIVRNLKNLERKISVKFEDHSVNYSTIITAVNTKHGVLVIDDLSPELPENSLRKGQRVIIETESDGQKINLLCQFIDVLVPNTKLGYQLKMLH